MSKSARTWKACFALAMIFVSAIVWWDMSQVEVVSLYDSAGPRLFPLLFASGLGICGVLVVIQAFTEESSELEAADLAPFLLVCGGLFVQILLMERIGWVPAATLQFMLVARAFGPVSLARAFGLGLAFALVTYIAFSYGLGLDLPQVPFADRLMGEV